MSTAVGPRRLTVLAALAVEAAALRRGGAPDVRRVGAGPDRVLPWDLGAAVVVAGTAGGLHDGFRPGDLVVASEVRTVDGDRIACHDGDALVAALRDRGLTVHRGPVVSARRLAAGAARRRLAGDGAVAVDTESGWWLPTLGPGPRAVVRAVVDTPAHELLRPATLSRGLAALRALRRAAGALVAWAGPAHGPATGGPATTAR